MTDQCINPSSTSSKFRRAESVFYEVGITEDLVRHHQATDHLTINRIYVAPRHLPK